MPITPNGPAPYPPTGKVLEVIDRHRQVGLPTPVTTEVVERVTGTPGLAPRIMRALTLFDLVDENGSPTPQFEELVKAPSESDFKERLASVIRAAYADVFQYVDPATASAEHLEGQFRNYTPRGQIGRMVGLFRGLCEYVGIVPEGQADSDSKPRPPRPRSPAAGSSKSNGSKSKPSTPGRTGHRRSPVPEDFQPSPQPSSGRHPFIAGLLQMLPDSGAEWPQAKREAWVKAALANFNLIYELPPEEREGGGSD